MVNCYMAIYYTYMYMYACHVYMYVVCTFFLYCVYGSLGVSSAGECLTPSLRMKF